MPPCRMAHVYSMGELLGHKGSRELVEAALGGLKGELHDDVNGGWYAGIAADGSVIPGKQCYAHAFVILAASSASLIDASGAGELLEEALDTYDRYFWDEEEGLAVDTWDTGFKSLSDYRGINANMHTVEAFLAVADVLHDEKYRERAGRIADRVISWAEENSWRIPEHFTKEWKADLMLNRDRPDDPFKPFGATPGHGIEWARLISQYAVSAFKGDKGKTEKYIGAARQLYERAMKDAWASDGAPGLCYTTDWEGRPVVHDRMHWTLAEAINTSAVLYRLTGLDRYAKDYAMFMEYLDEKVLDHKNGSWFHQLDRDKGRESQQRGEQIRRAVGRRRDDRLLPQQLEEIIERLEDGRADTLLHTGDQLAVDAAEQQANEKAEQEAGIDEDIPQIQQGVENRCHARTPL